MNEWNKERKREKKERERERERKNAEVKLVDAWKPSVKKKHD